MKQSNDGEGNLGMTNRLAAWMAVERIGDTELARKMGVTQVYVWKLRHGRVRVSPSFMWKFALVYGFDIARKLFEEEKVTA